MISFLETIINKIDKDNDIGALYDDHDLISIPNHCGIVFITFFMNKEYNDYDEQSRKYSRNR